MAIRTLTEYWTAVLAHANDLDRADAVAALLGDGTKLQFYAGGTLIREITTAAWARAALAQTGYPITPGAFTDPGTGAGTPLTCAVYSASGKWLLNLSVGVSSLATGGDIILTDPLSEGVSLIPGSFQLIYPSVGGQTPPLTGKRWHPGHYFYASQEWTHNVVMVESRRNRVKTNPYFKGYLLISFWDEMESTAGNYDFSPVLAELDKAEADGKMVWLRLQERSFHGMARGLPCPQYIADGGGTYADNTTGENIVAPKFWVPWVGQAWFECVAALMEAIDDHPALQGIMTEECSIGGAWKQPGYTWQAMNAFILEYCRIGSEGAKKSLWHQNMGWSNEPSTDTAEHYRMTDTVALTYKAGLSPTDLRHEPFSGGSYTDTTYGSYIPQRYGGTAFFGGLVEYPTYIHSPYTAKSILDYGVDDIGVHFIGWANTDYSASWAFTDTDAINEVTAQQGRINTTRPSNVPA